MESHIGGPIIIKNYIEISKDYKEAMQQYEANIVNNITTSRKPYIYKMKSISKMHHHNYMYTLIWRTPIKQNIKNLNQQYLFGNNQNLNSITEANNISNSHKFDGNSAKSKINQRNHNTKEKYN